MWEFNQFHARAFDPLGPPEKLASVAKVSVKALTAPTKVLQHFGHQNYTFWNRLIKEWPVNKAFPKDESPVVRRHGIRIVRMPGQKHLET